MLQKASGTFNPRGSVNGEERSDLERASSALSKISYTTAREEAMSPAPQSNGIFGEERFSSEPYIGRTKSSAGTASGIIVDDPPTKSVKALDLLLGMSTDSPKAIATLTGKHVHFHHVWVQY